MGKEKLTLSVDKEIVKKAKKLGINISEITENILKGYTSAERPNGSIYDAYRQLFTAITPLLKEFGGQVKVGEGVDSVSVQDKKGRSYDDEIPFSIFLDHDGSFYVDSYDMSITDIRKICQQDFLSPEKILSNLVDVLAKSKEANDEKMRQIMMAKRIVDAMSETLIKKPSEKSDEKG
jgi:hypothetical protein